MIDLLAPVVELDAADDPVIEAAIDQFEAKVAEQRSAGQITFCGLLTEEAWQP